MDEDRCYNYWGDFYNGKEINFWNEPAYLAFPPEREWEVKYNSTGLLGNFSYSKTDVLEVDVKYFSTFTSKDIVCYKTDPRRGSCVLVALNKSGVEYVSSVYSRMGIPL